MSDRQEDGPALTGWEILKALYQAVGCGPVRFDRIQFEHLVMVEIANDGDYHRQTIGSMIYEEVLLYDPLPTSAHLYLLGMGRRCSAYNSAEYAGDLLLRRVSRVDMTHQDMQVAIRSILKTSTYFKDSLLIAMADGQLAYPKPNRSRPWAWKDKLTLGTEQELRQLLRDHVTDGSEYRDDCMYPDGRLVTSKVARYCRQLVPKLSKRVLALIN